MREDILKFIKRELIGPDPVKPHIQENGEEILLNEPPRLRYGAGILFPKTIQVVRIDSTSEEEKAVLEKADDENRNNDEPVPSAEVSPPAEAEDDLEEEIGLANSYLPSAMGFSCFSIIPKDGFHIEINAAIYVIKEYTYKKDEENSITRNAYFRIPLDQEFVMSAKDIPTKSGKSFDKSIVNKDGNGINLKLNVRNRTPGEYFGKRRSFAHFHFD